MKIISIIIVLSLVVLGVVDIERYMGWNTPVRESNVEQIFNANSESCSSSINENIMNSSYSKEDMLKICGNTEQ
jgi:hypothetical protein